MLYRNVFKAKCWHIDSFLLLEFFFLYDVSAVWVALVVLFKTEGNQIAHHTHNLSSHCSFELFQVLAINLDSLRVFQLIWVHLVKNRRNVSNIPPFFLMNVKWILCKKVRSKSILITLLLSCNSSYFLRVGIFIF